MDDWVNYLQIIPLFPCVILIYPRVLKTLVATSDNSPEYSLYPQTIINFSIAHATL
jgi:hypothetical protein